MPARNVSLTPYLADFVDQNVKSGEFQNASEVVREGLRLLRERQEAEAAKLEALRSAVYIGLEDERRGYVTEIDLDDLRDMLAEAGRTGRKDPGRKG
ncbi:MAG TPA: type II toxin-antitoxin system ParD family antitoxin [Caulobacteraceae bacterium]|jgi:antitoxin ParD1/3/4|nr:type II toxin-antitoxin system ParD family antitoxin [Caulobacteraceae bacterium]